MEKSLSKDGGSGSAFDSSPTTPEEGDTALEPQTSRSPSQLHQQSAGLSLYRGALRIELPYSGSAPCTSPASPADGTTTTSGSPQTAIYRNAADGLAFHQREMEELLTPAAVVEEHARASALALLQAEAPARTTSASVAASQQRPDMLARSINKSTLYSPPVSGTFEMPETLPPPQRKRAGLQQFFSTRMRKSKNHHSLAYAQPAVPAASPLPPSSTAATTAVGMGIPPTVGSSSALYAVNDGSSGGGNDPDMQHFLLQRSPPPAAHDHHHDRHHLSSGNDTFEFSPYQHGPQLSNTLGASGEGNGGGGGGHGGTSPPTSSEQMLGLASSTSPPPTTHPVPTVATSDDAEDSMSSSNQGIGMEAVLRDASKIRGIRLTWLLYLLIVMAMTLFALLLVQILYESNRTLIRTATQAVRAQSSSLLNSADLEQYALERIFTVMHDTGVENFTRNSSTFAIVRETFCSRLYGAPLAFSMYNAAGKREWRMLCKRYVSQNAIMNLPPLVMPQPSAVQIIDYAWDIIVATKSFYSANGSIETFVVMMDKDTVGRTLLNNNFPQYSGATLQYVSAAFLTAPYNGTEPKMLFHTLTEKRPTYTSTANGSTHDDLSNLFSKICYTGSPYVWHTVSHYLNASEVNESSSSSSTSGDGLPFDKTWPITTTNPIPKPHLEYGRVWGQLSVANLCGVQCTGARGDTTCAYDNPTNVWFVVEYSLVKQNGLSSIVNVVGAVSVVALVLFSIVMFLVYLSITVPVNFLRFQLLRTVGANETQTSWHRRLVRWTYRLWLGDLTAIARSIHILSLCFRLNKKYVPDHVLRSHAQQLNLRRRKFNFLDEVDLKDDLADIEDTDSENDDGDSPLPPLAGASTVLPPSESRFLWRLSVPNDMEDAAGTAAAVHEPSAPDVFSTDGRAGVNAAVPASLSRSVAGAEGPPLALLESSVLVKKSASGGRRSGIHAQQDSTGMWPYTELEGTIADFDTSLMISLGHHHKDNNNATISTMLGPGATVGGAGASHISGGVNVGGGNTMAIRREFESTILCIRIPSVELAYLLNHSAAAIQHRRIMRILLHRIRRHKGGLFHRSGDCLAAVWNAFEGCPNHAETAAVCAQEITNALAPFRVEGLHVGLVLHQGLLVCGTVEYTKAAFVTAFGDGPREAFALAELAATIGSLNILVTEPVKQELGGLYDCNIVDVIHLPNSAHPLLLFELGGSRSPHLSVGSQAATTLQPQPQRPMAPVRSQFAIEYARAFAQFRNHEFSEALQGIEHIRAVVGCATHEHLLRRLERLCCFYATQSASLPQPYSRAYPVWTNYEAIAQAGLRNDPNIASMRNTSLLCHSFMDGVVYKGVPAIRNDVEYIKDFKQELQENMRRTARKGGNGNNGSGHTNGGCGSPTVDESSTRPHITPQSSPPMRPMGDSTMVSERVLSVASNTLLDASLHAPPSLHHGNNNNLSSDSVALIDLPTPLPTPQTIVPPLTPLSPLPPLTSSPLQKESDPAFGRAGSTVDSSLHPADSPRDVYAMSNRFSMTHRVTDRPPVALAASPDTPALLAEQVLAETLTQVNSVHSSAHGEGTSNSFIQSAGMSFQESAARMQDRNGNRSSNNFSINSAALPLEIKAKNGTTYLRSTRILGKGSFGCVYLGMDAHSGRLVAIKFLPLPSDESGMEDIEAEVVILQRVNDTHVVQLHSYAFESDTIVIVMECMLAGSLQNMISAFRTIPSATARVFMRDVLRGLSKIHSMGVIHRDMKPQNVLLSLSGNCKISDFGASAWLQELARKESKGQICGTPVYLAPEAARGSPMKESDIWSCGIMFLQMITGVLPYAPEQLSAGAAVLVFQIGSGIAQPHIPDILNELDSEFVHACLHVEPGKRLTAAALLQLPIFTV